MGVLNKVTDFVAGSLFKEIKEGVMAYFPPDVSPTDRAKFEVQLERMANEKQLQTSQLLVQASQALDNRIKAMEGTAKDLMHYPFLGRLILFARGMQRPVWGFSTLWMDFQWFFGATVTFTDKQEQTLLVINILVLGFLFGERTIHNLTPLLLKIWGNKANKE